MKLLRATAVVALAAAGLWAATPSSAPSPAVAVGAYRLAGGGLVALVPDGRGVRLVDYATGALRRLAQRSPSVFVGGPGVAVPTPVRVRVQLQHDGGIRVNGRAGRRLALVARSASFASGSVRIEGRLLLPPGRGPFPAIVIVPGSVRATRDTYDLWAYFFAAHGFAVLTADKRGVAASGGSYVRAATEANLRALAADALAGVDWLRRQPSVDADRIGLAGGSQAGWTIVLAAAESPAVRFAAIQSGPAMSVARQAAYAALTREGALDPPPTEAQIAARLAATPDGGYDPRPDLASLHIPVLWQLGSVDKRMHTVETVADLAALTAGGAHDFTVRVYPGGAHSLRVTAHGLIAEEQASPGFVPGVFRDLAAWLGGHTG